MESKGSIPGRGVQIQGVFRDRQVILIQLEGVWEARIEKQIEGEAKETGLNLRAQWESTL